MSLEHLSKEFLEKLNKEQELNLNQIAQQLNLNPRLLSFRFKELGLPLKKFYKGKRKELPPKEEFIEDYFIKELPKKELFKKWNLSEDLLRKTLKTFNLQRRTRKAYNKIDFSQFEPLKEEITQKLKSELQTTQEIADGLGISHPVFKTLLYHLNILLPGESICHFRYSKETTLGSSLQRKKYQETCLKKYGVPHVPLSSQTRSSKGEKELLRFCQEKLSDSSIKKDHDVLKSINKELDIFIPSHNLAIEHCGAYYHSLFHPQNTPFDHSEKFFVCKKKGIQLLTFWDFECKEKKELVFSMILAKCKQFETRIFGRECSLQEIDFDDAKRFYQENHIQGLYSSSQAKMTVALVKNNEPLGMMSLGVHHRKNVPDLVLSRCCFKKNVQVVGGSQKMFSFLVNKYNPRSLVSWSDNRFSWGTLYPYLGFSLEEELKEDYFYLNVLTGQRCSKQSLKKQTLLKMGGLGEHEKELAESLGFYRVFDCGKIRWRWNHP